MILVTGAEATGTRMMARMVNEAGGSALHWPMPQGTRGVWRPVPECSAALVMVRDAHATVAAQVAAGHVVNPAQATANIRRAYLLIFAALANQRTLFTVVSYESLARPEALGALFALVGLDGSAVTTRWQDANAKHYGGPAWEDHRNVNGLPVAPAAVQAHRKNRAASTR